MNDTQDIATLYFDTVSPFAYLMWKSLQRTPFGQRIRPVPVVFGAILQHWGQLGPAEIGPKRLHTYRYCQWLAGQEGIPFRFPPAHPFRSLASLRLIAALDNSEMAITTVFDAIFMEGLDLADTRVLAGIGQRLGIDDVPALITAKEAAARLRANTEAAIAQGVFGVPTLAVRGQLFWGFDALPMARHYLRAPDMFAQPEMMRLAELPVGISRAVGNNVERRPLPPG
jgi:2-hydroxychromene-2-carboxylate isomerase